MSLIETGGPAFPWTADRQDRGDVPGMTLRDYFATHIDFKGSMNQSAAENLIGREMPSLDTEAEAFFKFWADVEAKLRYQKADSMLQARWHK